MMIIMDKVMDFKTWEELYRNKDVEGMPWYNKDLDADLAKELLDRKLSKGRFLDIGTGPGTQAIALAGMGFQATGSDISESAIEKAKSLLGAGNVEFVVDDMVNSRLKDSSFDFIIDRGALHTLSPDQWDAYLETVNRILVKGGLLFLKCFSIDEPMEHGPHKFSKEDIKRIFSKDFEIESIKDSIYYGKIEPQPRVLFSVLRKK
jgi:cyclopropane fatty-acyl-phospholipid synthase-like methyltransferase